MNRPITFRTLLITNGFIVLLLVAVLLVSTTTAHPLLQSTTLSATETTTISYQGNLTGIDGTPINGTLPMTFALYRDRTGGTAIWTEERTGDDEVPVTDGLFTVMLGSMEPLETSLFDEDLWLGISMNGDDEMSPRERLYGGYATIAGTVVDGAISSAKLALQHDRKCLEEELEIDSDSSGEVPGMSLDFALDQPALVLVSIEGVASFDPAASTNNRYELSLNVDGEREALSVAWAGTFDGFDAQRVLPLDAGNHTLSAGAYAQDGTIKLYSSEYRYSGNQLCINYVVLGDQ